MGEKLPGNRKLTSDIADQESANSNWLDEKEYPFLNHYTEIDGNKIHYIDEGQGPTLVFLHNVVLWSYEFRKIVKQLRNSFRCIALDYPGFGLSEASSDFHNSIRSNGNIVEAFIRKLNLGRIVLVCSEGSVPIGILVAERNPESVLGLVLSGGFAWPLGKQAFGKDRMSNFFSKFIASGLSRFLIEEVNFMNWYTVNFFPEKGKLSSADKRAYSVPYKPKSKRYHQADLISIGRKDPVILVEIEQRSKEIAYLPVLILSGEFDPTHKAGWHERLAQMFPNNRLETVQGAHHFPTEYSPEYYASAIQNWVGGNRI
jgi:haloalkane dehalogenase